jgi:hypothetical protein
MKNENQYPTKPETAQRLYAPFLITKPHHYLEDTFVKELGSIYVEDEELCETSILRCEEYDMEGRSTVGTLGTFVVEPHMFNVITYETHDKTKHWHKYSLNEFGWEHLELNGLKHPGRGYVKTTLMTTDAVELEIKENQQLINGLLETNINLNQIIT